MNNTIFAERLREARTAAKLTQADLSKKAGVTAATISAYESADGSKGKNPSLDNALKLAAALNVSLDWLCGNEVNPLEIETEIVLRSCMKLIFDYPHKSGLYNDDDDNYYLCTFGVDVDKFSCFYDFLKRTVELKEIADKNILPDDMLFELKQSTIDKYKSLSWKDLVKNQLPF